jgi:hypothetical protein
MAAGKRPIALLNHKTMCYMFINLKVGCLHPVACTRSGSGFPPNATLF